MIRFDIALNYFISGLLRGKQAVDSVKKKRKKRKRRKRR